MRVINFIKEIQSRSEDKNKILTEFPRGVMHKNDWGMRGGTHETVKKVIAE